MNFLYDGSVQNYDPDLFVEVMGLVGAKEFSEFQHDFRTIPVRWAVADTTAIQVNSPERLNEAKELSQSGTTLRWFQLSEEEWEIATDLFAHALAWSIVEDLYNPGLYSTNYFVTIRALSYRKKSYQASYGSGPDGALGVLENYPKGHRQELWISTEKDLLFDKLASTINAGNTGEIFIVDPGILAFVMRRLFPPKAESTPAAPTHAS